MSSIRNMLKKFDMNPSTEDSFKVRTLAGAFSMALQIALGIVSVVTVSIMAVLFWGELKLYMYNVVAFIVVIIYRSVWKIWSLIKRQRHKQTFHSPLIFHCSA